MRRADYLLWIADFSLLLLYLCLLCSAYCLQKGPQKATYATAAKQCSVLKEGSALSDPFFWAEGSELKKTGIFNFWLPYRRVVYYNYTWIDGTQAGSSLNILGHKIGFPCGTVDLQNGDFDFLPCHQGSSFICQIPGCSTCRSINKDSLECLVTGNQCFTYHCGSSNWYRARESCKRQHGDLAVIKDELDINLLSKFWEMPYGSSCATPWIGLYREQWQTQGGVVPTLSFWGKGEPKKYDNCSIISIANHDFSWRVASCDEEYLYFCDQETAEGSVKTTVGDTYRLNTESQVSVKRDLFLISGIVLFIAVFAMLVLVLFFMTLLRKYKKKRVTTRENSDLSDTNRNEHGDEKTGGHGQETISLIDCRNEEYTEQADVHAILDATGETGLRKEEKVTFETSREDRVIHINFKINL